MNALRCGTVRATSARFISRNVKIARRLALTLEPSEALIATGR
jgi:hypothetical protein